MISYNTYSYLFPPRPEHKIKRDFIKIYDNGEFLAQPKYNGSCCVVFMNKDASGKFFLKVMNRHAEPMTLVDLKEIDFQGIYESIENNNGFMVVCGELLNKSKVGETGKKFNQKLILWDILVNKGEYLLDTTILFRLQLLKSLFPTVKQTQAEKKLEDFDFKHIDVIGIRGVYRAPYYETDFSEMFDALIKTEIYEGIIMKRKAAKLENGYRGNNNSNWQVKCRKQTKNYKL